MKIKQLFIHCFALIALAGIFNCTMIEPAFAYKDDCTASCQDETHCSVCHFSNHQWVNFPNSISFSGLLPATVVSHETIETALNPPTGLIFHPPITL